MKRSLSTRYFYEWPFFDKRIIELALNRPESPNHVYIAYSGGMDSHVLLHICASAPELQGKVTAAHIHHGLQTAADAWPEHCRSVAMQLGVEFIVIDVDARNGARESPEEAARNARYRALKSLLSENDLLLVAQHREDQLETFLLQLFRGSGLQGLSGMPAVMSFGKGFLLRPLLNASKQSIEQYARHHELHFIEDPSNKGSEFDRNFLRNEILPLLKQRWPAIDKTVARSAGHCAESFALLDKLLENQFRKVYRTQDSTLSIPALLQLDEPEQALLVRKWLASFGLKMPPRALVIGLLAMLRANSRDPQLANQKHTIRRYRDRLFCVPQPHGALPERDVIWPHGDQSLDLPDGTQLKLKHDRFGIDSSVWLASQVEVKYRSGGEKMSLPKREGRHSLKNLYQEEGVPPWERPYIPLVYLNGRLAAVADLWIGAEFYCENRPGCVRFVRTQK